MKALLFVPVMAAAMFVCSPEQKARRIPSASEKAAIDCIIAGGDLQRSDVPQGVDGWRGGGEQSDDPGYHGVRFRNPLTLLPDGGAPIYSGWICHCLVQHPAGPDETEEAPRRYRAAWAAMCHDGEQPFRRLGGKEDAPEPK